MHARLRRVLWLLLCLAAGSLVAWLGHAFTGHAAWVLALPGALAVGWWALADPTRCAVPGQRGDGAPGP